MSFILDEVKLTGICVASTISVSVNDSSFTIKSFHLAIIISQNDVQNVIIYILSLRPILVLKHCN